MRGEETVGSDLVTVEEGKSNKDSVEISTTITVGDISGGEYKISVCLWDGLETMIFYRLNNT